MISLLCYYKHWFTFKSLVHRILGLVDQLFARHCCYSLTRSLTTACSSRQHTYRPLGGGGGDKPHNRYIRRVHCHPSPPFHTGGLHKRTGKCATLLDIIMNIKQKGVLFCCNQNCPLKQKVCKFFRLAEK